jgi:hypothetical protein
VGRVACALRWSSAQTSLRLVFFFAFPHSQVSDTAVATSILSSTNLIFSKKLDLQKCDLLICPMIPQCLSRFLACQRQRAERAVAPNKSFLIVRGQTRSRVSKRRVSFVRVAFANHPHQSLQQDSERKCTARVTWTEVHDQSCAFGPQTAESLKSRPISYIPCGLRFL